jgi:glycosyltransferase involved in cell wall biosynthesis
MVAICMLKEMLLTIITVVKNDFNNIEKTIQSVIEKKPSWVEYIVIDGKSTDGTVGKIRKFKEINKFICEIDSGLYEAMNKGLTYSTGKWIFFINSGDYLVKNFYTIIKPYLINENGIIQFNTNIINNKSEIIPVRKYPKDETELLDWPCIQHQSTFCKLNDIKNLGGFNQNLKILSDYDFFIRAHKKKINFKFIPEIKISYYNSEGLSTYKRNIPKMMQEIKKIQLYYFGKYNIKIQIQLILKYILITIDFNGYLMSLTRKIFLIKR